MRERVLVVEDSTTVRRVVQRTLGRAGYEVVLARDGREALERLQTIIPDLILLDFVLPHMNGHEVCLALRRVSNLRGVPVVLMSAKADRIAEKFMRETGAVDAISKPFGPEALLAVTANALAKGRLPAGEEVRAPEADSAKAEAARDVDWLADGQWESAADAARYEAARATASRLASAMGPVVRTLAGAEEPSDERLALAIANGFEHEELFALAADLKRLSPGHGGARSFEAKLEHVPLGETLQMLQHGRQSGVLEIQSGERTIIVCLRDGLVDIAMGRGSEPEFLLGRYMLEEDLVDRDDLEQLLRRRRGSKRLLGTQLVKLGYITLDDLRRALVRQTSELAYEALRWVSGAYWFEAHATRPEALEAKLALPIASILMEGLRRVDEWHLIEEQIDDFEMIPALRQDALATIVTDDLSLEERAVIDAIDGERNVREIVRHLEMGSFAACKILFQLMTSGLVHETTQPAASTT